jgi:hypothetical protein
MNAPPTLHTSTALGGRPVTPVEPNRKAPRQWWSCPRCHRVVPRLSEIAELLAAGEIRHILCDGCAAEVRADPIGVFDFILELAS